MNKTIKKVIDERQTVKAYNDKKISDSDWKDIIETIQWAPSSHGFEPYRVLVIEKESKLREELKAMMWGQKTVIEADKLIFFISLKHKIFSSKDFIYKRALRRAEKVVGLTGEKAEEVANTTLAVVKDKHLKLDEPYDDWSMKQAYIALGMALYSATILGIGSTPIEGMEKAKVESLFKKHKLTTDDERVAVAAAFGYPQSKTAYAHWGSGKRVRDPEEKKFVTIKD